MPRSIYAVLRKSIRFVSICATSLPRLPTMTNGGSSADQTRKTQPKLDKAWSVSYPEAISKIGMLSDVNVVSKFMAVGFMKKCDR